MTIKEFYIKKADEDFDEKLYNEAKTSRKPLFLVMAIISFVLAFWSTIIFLSLAIGGSGVEIIVFGVYLIGLFVAGGCVLISFYKKSLNPNEETVHSIYVEKYLNREFKNNSIPKEFLDLEYDDLVLSYNVTKRYQFGKLIIDYNEDDKSIRIFDKVELGKPILFKDILEYNLVDEGRIVCSCKRGETKATSNFIYNGFECARLELKLFIDNDNGGIVTKEYTVLAKVDRDKKKYLKAVDFFKYIFGQMDSYLLEINNHEEEQSIPESKDDKTAYEKLIQLKKLYDDGIIDQSTYEEKKKKLVEKL